MYALSRSSLMCYSAGQGRLRALGVLLVVIMVAGGCATGTGTTTGKTETTGKVETTAKADTTGKAETTGTVAITGTTGTGEPAAKVDAHAMEMTTGSGVAPAGRPADSLKDSLTDSDKRHQWLGQTFASVIDAADQAFGEPRIEDQQEIVRAKVGLRAEYINGEGTSYNIPTNFRIPLPSLTRKANLFIDVTSDSDTNDISNVSADGSASLAMLKKLTKDVDVILAFDVYGGFDVGPKVKFRFEHDWKPWKLFAEQQVFVRTDDGWGGRTTVNFDLALPDGASFFRFTNRADYYEELDGVNFSDALMYRRKFYFDTALSVELGVQYNAYSGDPEKKNTYTPPDTGVDDDNAYFKFRVVGKGWQEWIEWEVVPSYYYKWEQDDPWRWGVDLRLSVMYQAFLRPPPK